jgi:hypothetical protein
MEKKNSDETSRTTRYGFPHEILRPATSPSNSIWNNAKQGGDSPNRCVTEAIILRKRANSELFFSTQAKSTEQGLRARSYSSPKEQISNPFADKINSQKVAFSIQKSASPIAELNTQETIKAFIESQTQRFLESIQSKDHFLFEKIKESSPLEDSADRYSGSQSSSHNDRYSEDDIFDFEPNSSDPCFRV